VSNDLPRMMMVAVASELVMLDSEIVLTIVAVDAGQV